MDEERFARFNEEYMGIKDEDVVLGHILLNIMEVETSGYIERHHFLKLFVNLKYQSPHPASTTPGSCANGCLSSRRTFTPTNNSISRCGLNSTAST